MDPAIRRLQIVTLKAKVELCRTTLEALEREFNRPDITADKFIEFFQRFDEVVRDRKSALKKLAALERDEREG
jgi:hypothetical protein